MKIVGGVKVRGSLVRVNRDADLAANNVDVGIEIMHPMKRGDYIPIKVDEFEIEVWTSMNYESTLTCGIVSGLGSTQPPFGILTEKEAFSLDDVILTVLRGEELVDLTCKFGTSREEG